ncbi:MAG TPA: ribosomal-protein-alanine N-acetyltransferase [Gammaproteobacteria bacterium]|nr:ribosomal-protein-alanine N-acetyltransferase [Gammaproteobacteria bacterium]
MRPADVAEILKIEVAVYPTPWTEGIFNDCIRVGYNCWVYLEQGKIISYGLVSVAANEAHVLNLCVAPHAQGCGHGKRMLYKLIALAEERQASSIFLEVRESNIAALNLYEKEGFNRIGLRKGYYPGEDGREDALVFARELNLNERFEEESPSD